MDIQCQHLADCPSPELSKRAASLANGIDDIVSEYFKNVTPVQQEARRRMEAAAEGGAEWQKIQSETAATINGFQLLATGSYRRIEPDITAMRRVLMDRLGEHDMSKNPYYEWAAQRGASVMEFREIAADLRTMAGELLALRTR